MKHIKNVSVNLAVDTTGILRWWGGRYLFIIAFDLTELFVWIHLQLFTQEPGQRLQNESVEDKQKQLTLTSMWTQGVFVTHSQPAWQQFFQVDKMTIMWTSVQQWGILATHLLLSQRRIFLCWWSYSSRNTSVFFWVWKLSLILLLILLKWGQQERNMQLHMESFMAFVLHKVKCYYLVSRHCEWWVSKLF